MTSYRPNYGADPPGPGARSEAPRGPKAPMYQFQGNNNKPQHLQAKPPRDFSFRPSRQSDRFQQMSIRGITPEPFGADHDTAAHSTKFRELENLTDSDEADMEVSESDGGEPRRKKARTLVTSDALGDSAPKWSNPDPYSVLPPSDDPARKRKDVVKLIRKARVSATQASETANAVTANDDFISFGGDNDIDQVDHDMFDAPEGAPIGPRANRSTGTRTDPRPASDPSLGNRKRTYDDDIKAPSRDVPARPVRAGKPGKSFNADGSIVLQWRHVDVTTAAPWYNSTRDGDRGYPAAALHKEVIDLYYWAKPQTFEHQIRTDLISRLEKIFYGKYPGCKLKAFGSFAAGLYLPIADMDLVLLSTRFVQSKVKTLGVTKSQVWQCAAHLKRSGVAVDDSVLAIPSAKVPIVKFIDKVTGLRVDLSFDNDSGIIANDTFLAWKLEYPAMPIIVSIVKQFLLLRGLNDVATGGLGGFSIICLVTSLLQHLPPSGGLPNLGTLLMDFFNFYGNEFDQSTLGINLNPPGYFDKRMEGNFPYNQNKAHRLCIVDPNRPDNDISGGTAEIELILITFKRAFARLQERLNQLARGKKFEDGLLGCILAGDYRPYDQQRQHLRQIHYGSSGFTTVNARMPAQLPPPPPPPTQLPPREQPPPPPPLSLSNARGSTAKPKSKQVLAPPTLKPDSQGGPDTNTPQETRKTMKALIKLYHIRRPATDKHTTRALMLKDLRPELPNVPDAITPAAAKELGGYRNPAEMAQDLWSRAVAKGKIRSRPTITKKGEKDGAKAAPLKTKNDYYPPLAVGDKTVDQVKAETQGVSKDRVRASILKEMRPDIPNVPDSLKVDAAAKLGGYKNHAEMHQAFQRISQERLKATRSDSST